MSARSFTKEEMVLLRQNKYTYSVTPNTISFTIEFKKEFWKRYQAGQRPRDIVEALGYDFQMLGDTRVSGIQSTIEDAKEMASSFGLESGSEYSTAVLAGEEHPVQIDTGDPDCVDMYFHIVKGDFVYGILLSAPDEEQIDDLRILFEKI